MQGDNVPDVDGHEYDQGVREREAPQLDQRGEADRQLTADKQVGAGEGEHGAKQLDMPD